MAGGCGVCTLRRGGGGGGVGLELPVEWAGFADLLWGSGGVCGGADAGGAGRGGRRGCAAVVGVVGGGGVWDWGDDGAFGQWGRVSFGSGVGVLGGVADAAGGGELVGDQRGEFGGGVCGACRAAGLALAGGFGAAAVCYGGDDFGSAGFGADGAGAVEAVFCGSAAGAGVLDALAEFIGGLGVPAGEGLPRWAKRILPSGPMM